MPVTSRATGSASARKPTWPRLTPSSGVPAGRASSAARSSVPSPPSAITSAAPCAAAASFGTTTVPRRSRAPAASRVEDPDRDAGVVQPIRELLGDRDGVRRDGCGRPAAPSPAPGPVTAGLPRRPRVTAARSSRRRSPHATTGSTPRCRPARAAGSRRRRRCRARGRTRCPATLSDGAASASPGPGRRRRRRPPRGPPRTAA